MNYLCIVPQTTHASSSIASPRQPQCSCCAIAVCLRWRAGTESCASLVTLPVSALAVWTSSAKGHPHRKLFNSRILRCCSLLDWFLLRILFRLAKDTALGSADTAVSHCLLDPTLLISFSNMTSAQGVATCDIIGLPDIGP